MSLFHFVKSFFLTSTEGLLPFIHLPCWVIGLFVS